MVPLAPGVERCGHDEVERRLQLAAQGRPDVGDRPVGRQRQADRHPQRIRLLRHLSPKHVDGEGVHGKEAREHRGKEAVLVLGALRPGGHQVGELELPWRRPALHHVAAFVPRFLELHPAPLHVLVDVVEVEVQRRGVAARRPVLRGRLEGDIDVGTVEDIPAHEGPERFIDVVDHPPPR